MRSCTGCLVVYYLFDGLSFCQPDHKLECDECDEHNCLGCHKRRSFRLPDHKLDCDECDEHNCLGCHKRRSFRLPDHKLDYDECDEHNCAV